MTIARLHLGRRSLRLSIHLEPAPQGQDAVGHQLRTRYEREQAAKALEQERSTRDSRLLGLGHRPV